MDSDNEAPFGPDYKTTAPPLPPPPPPQPPAVVAGIGPPQQRGQYLCEQCSNASKQADALGRKKQAAAVLVNFIASNIVQ